MKFNRILIVCTGNICRSPVAEALLKARLPWLTVESAGLGALSGQAVDPSARALAEHDGLEVSSHRARQVEAEMIQRADLVLVMSEGQRKAVGKLVPAAIGKTMLFGHWLGQDSGGKDIPDPYHKSPEAFQHVHQLLVHAADAWASKL